MAIFKSISSITNSASSLNSSISNSKFAGSSTIDNSIACFDGGFGGWGGLGGSNGFDGCSSGGNTNIINIDIDIGRRRRRCC
ncbi:hypothetical protein RB653_010440 [Dictyostelium firmibasis]|uniref:Uncharacterized protein n=1 Tax=Dictyostelium firmibasis TaxID=79012 RepID=A0AAN7TLX3_9MYCE